MVRLLVTGGRDYGWWVEGKSEADRLAEVTHIESTLALIHEKRGITVLIHGDAQGADTVADCWCRFREIAVLPFLANWKKFGNAAGPIRNKQMLDEGKPDGIVAFPGGNGTADMVARGEAAGLVVWRR